MEITKAEVSHLEEAAQVSCDDQIRQLSDFQLAFVGGGIAELVGV
jgi:hypothetical protein